MQEGSDESFTKHVQGIKLCYCEVHSVGTWEELKTILALLNSLDSDVQQGLFKLYMKSNCDAVMAPLYSANPLTCLWKMVTNNQLLCYFSPKFVKLAKIAMVYVVGNVENEWCFSSLSFLKLKLRNALGSVMGMCSQRQFNLVNFPYDEAIDSWMGLVPCWQCEIHSWILIIEILVPTSSIKFCDRAIGLFDTMD